MVFSTDSRRRPLDLESYARLPMESIVSTMTWTNGTESVDRSPGSTSAHRAPEGHLEGAALSTRAGRLPLVRSTLKFDGWRGAPDAKVR